MPRRILIALFAFFAILASISPAQAGTVSTSFKLTKAQVASGTVTSGVIFLGSAATSSKTFTVESADEKLATVPATIKIAKGKSNVSVPITAGYSTSVKTVEITIANGGTSKTAKLTILPLKVESVTFSPTSVRSGTTSKATIKLNGPAPSAGKTVKLTTSGPIKAATSVKVAAGKTSATVTVSTKEVFKSSTGKLTADLKVKVTANLTVVPLKIKTVSLSPSAVDSGDDTVFTVTMDGKAPAGGIEVDVLASGSNGPGIPETIVVEEGATSATYEFDVPELGNVTAAGITFQATYNENSKSANLEIAPIGRLSSVSFSEDSITAGESATVTIQLTNEPYSGALNFSATLSKEGGDTDSANDSFYADETTYSDSITFDEPGTYTFSVTYIDETETATITVLPVE